MNNVPVVILGCGPAGLAASYELIKSGTRPLILEKSDKIGGIARTEMYNGYCFDIGGHRFFTKNEQISQIWQEMLGDDFLKVPRVSRIYYRSRFFNYPLQAFDALSKLGILESSLIFLSYIKAQLFLFSEEKTFEQWVSKRFGKRLYKTFFKTYTEKIWGIPCHKIQADWAAQRIKGLSLIVAISNALIKTQGAKSLIEEFDYPLKGPGMMWQRFLEKVEEGGGQVSFNAEVIKIKHENGRIISVGYIDEDNRKKEVVCRHLISSIPITKLVTLFDPKVPDEVLKAAQNLSFRAFIIVILIIDKKDLFPDQWIYVHSPNVKVGRIQNFKNWSKAMLPDHHKTSIGMEYFCNEGDDKWRMSDDELKALAFREFTHLDLAKGGTVIDSFVVRQPDAYPVYDQSYKEHLGVIGDFLGNLNNFQTIGRSGLYRYNNMDHSMQTGMLAAQNVLGASHNLWEVNEEKEYLEEDKGKKAEQSLYKSFTGTFARMDTFAFACAMGLVSGLNIFLATIWLIIKGGKMVGPNLQLLNQYLAGYAVTLKGAFIGFGYFLFWGFLFGWLFAYLRNLFLAFYIYTIKKKVEILSFRDFIDHF